MRTSLNPGRSDSDGQRFWYCDSKSLPISIVSLKSLGRKSFARQQGQPICEILFFFLLKMMGARTHRGRIRASGGSLGRR